MSELAKWLAAISVTMALTAVFIFIVGAPGLAFIIAFLFAFAALTSVAGRAASNHHNRK